MNRIHVFIFFIILFSGDNLREGWPTSPGDFDTHCQRACTENAAAGVCPRNTGRQWYMVHLVENILTNHRGFFVDASSQSSQHETLRNGNTFTNVAENVLYLYKKDIDTCTLEGLL
jgi:hypothetical protein